jgi:hypothetical protein
LFQALSIVDHESFRELLIFQRAKTKESDIPHRTKVTECVLERAAGIRKELARELVVSCVVFPTVRILINIL